MFEVMRQKWNNNSYRCTPIGVLGRVKPEMSWVQLLVAAGLFTFLYFRLITFKFIHFQLEGRCSEHLE